PGSRWARALAAAWQEESAAGLGYQDPLGHRGLREEIATHLRASLGMICQAEQVIVAAGSQGAVDLCCRVLVDPGEPVAMEDPGGLGARLAALASGARIVPVPVDANGMDVARLTDSGANLRVIFVSPSHQFPTGVALSLERRLALITFAAQTGAWILEDGGDGYLRYGGRQLDPLAVLDRTGHVIYVGTFSNVMFPALRLGYLVIPLELVDVFAAAHLSVDIHRPALEQAALARFIREGHFALHLRRSREVHAERRQALLDAAQEVFDGTLAIAPAQAGLHLLVRLPADVDDVAVAEAALRRGVDVRPLSIYNLASDRRGLLLGYGGVPPALIRPAVERLEAAIHEVAG
ncbi:MAG TPA: PLP-dependent aminotransferase family protein, partial [Actinomycetota bacterium]|nr:PLP-dependent aminotransferase family protein [Actinomycetota bacterium]